MKLPRIFVPEKSLDDNIERMLNTKKVIKHQEIEDVFSLLNLPENVWGYRTNYKKIEDKKIPSDAWLAHFGSSFRTYLVEAGKVNYTKGLPPHHKSVIVYSLNFFSNSELNEMIRKVDITQEFLYLQYDKYKDWNIECLKKDNYVVGILLDKEVMGDLNFFKYWYVDNFGMVEI